MSYRDSDGVTPYRPRTKICEVCGGSFKGQAAARLCARCRRERHNMQRSDLRLASKTACSGCGKSGVSSKSGLCAKCARPGKLIPCPRCGAMFWPWAPLSSGKRTDHARKLCGCKPQPKAKPEPNRKPCKWCGAEHGRQGAHCSRVCAKRTTNARKHLRRRGLRKAQEAIPMPEIYERDKGVCGICRRRVAAALTAPDPGAPTIDHIVPISKGGKHIRSNVQLAHYGCNSRKRDRRCGSQMRLAEC